MNAAGNAGLRAWMRGAIGAGLLCAVHGASGYTYVLPSDESLLERAELVVEGRVLARLADPANPLGATLYVLEPGQSFKGFAPARIRVRIPGAVDPLAGGALVVPGMPVLAPGARAVLFLRWAPDGSFVPDGFALGVFKVESSAAGEFLQRDLSAGHELGGAAEDAAQVRDLGRFAAWLRARMRGWPQPADYWRGRPADQAKYSLQGSPPARWFEFGEATNVSFHASPAGQAGVLGGGFAEFQAALRAWNDDAGSTVRYVYGGTTAANGGLERMDGVNAIHFNDPASNLAGVFDCFRGGVVAYAGWRSRGARSFAGRSFQPIVEADIVVQDGAGCVLGAVAGNSNAAEVFAHEVGHTLGLGHSCSDDGLPACQAGTPADDALMRPYIHRDGRGAALRSDDRNAVTFLYPAFAGAVPPPEAVSGGNQAAEETGGGGGGGSPSPLLLLALALSAAASARARART